MSDETNQNQQKFSFEEDFSELEKQEKPIVEKVKVPEKPKKPKRATRLRVKPEVKKDEVKNLLVEINSKLDKLLMEKTKTGNNEMTVDEYLNPQNTIIDEGFLQSEVDNVEKKEIIDNNVPRVITW